MISLSRLAEKRRHLAAARRADQRGLTLLEVMITSAISGMIAVPLLAWMVTAFRAETTIRATSDRTGITTQLNQYLPRDVASSSKVLYVGGAAPAAGAATGYDCTDADASDRVALSLLNHDGTQYVVYAAVEAPDGRSAVIRRVCDRGSASSSSVVLASEIRASTSGLLGATNSASGARGSDLFARVDMTLTLPTGEPILVTGGRRTGEDRQ